MKQLRSSSQNLRELFEQNISIRYIAEPLTSFDVTSLSTEVFAFMEKQDYDVVGIRQDGLVIGYVRKTDLAISTIKDHLNRFTASDVDMVDETAPLLDALKILRLSPCIFVRVLGRVGGIVTHGDLQKAPVRMWLFGLISLIEMQMLRLIREEYPRGEWESYISPKRLIHANKILEDRRKRNVAIDLTDCLEWCDKSEIILKGGLFKGIGLSSKKQGEKFFYDLEKLRNNLAHAQDIMTGYWPGIGDLVEKAETLLKLLEKPEFSKKEIANDD